MDIRIALANASASITLTLKDGLEHQGQLNTLAQKLGQLPDTSWAIGDADIIPAGPDGDEVAVGSNYLYACIRIGDWVAGLVQKVLAPQDPTGRGDLTPDSPEWVWVEVDPTTTPKDWWEGSDYVNKPRPDFRRG